CSFVFYLLPPLSILFPYTTLFRSCDRQYCLTGRSVPHRRKASGGGAPLQTGARPPRANVGAGASGRRRDAEELGGPACRSRAGRDRKSTRLNSSHGSISYAVFCLK